MADKKITVTVTTAFMDKTHKNQWRKVDEEIEVTEDRAQDLAKKGKVRLPSEKKEVENNKEKKEIHKP